MSEQRAQIMEAASSWVIKLGSNVLLGRGGRLDRPTFAGLIQGVDALERAQRSVTLVSSGAVALGRQLMGRMSGGARPSIPRLQALAALGQPRLLKLYELELGHYGRRVAQLLFTRGDLSDRGRYLNARYAIDEVRALGALPIINENDTVATEELRFGDNDQLAAMTCGLVGADLLVILSDVDGIFEVAQGEHGERIFTERIEQIEADHPRLDVIAGPSRSGVGTGGMVTKVEAARIAARVGVPTIIAPGKRQGVLEALAAGEPVGTLLVPPAGSGGLSGRKVWLGAGARPVGQLWCDEGAVAAVCERGASLLPSGVTRVEGEFEEGAVVELVDERGERFGLGLSVYGAEDLRRIAGARSDEIAARLGFKLVDEAIHRDNLALSR